MARADRPRPGVDDVTLVPVSPSQQRRRLRLTVLAVLVLMAVALGAGFWLGHTGSADNARLNRQLHLKLAETRATLAEVRHDMAVYRAESQVGEKARDRLRGEIRALHDQLAELEEAVAFYKNVMAPADNGEPLQVQKFELAPTDTPGQFRYRLILVQSGNNRGYLSGQVRFRIQGRRQGKPVTIDAAEMLADNSDLRFRFRYFQKLTGMLRVPEGVEPVSLEVVARSTGGRRSEAHKSAAW